MIVILGGGLAGSLLAYRLSKMNPRPDFLLIESQDRLGGNHTWSFHESDLSFDPTDWMRDLIACSWNQQEVRFRDFSRVLSQPYHSVTSARLHHLIQSQIENHLLLNEPVLRVDSDQVYLRNKKIEAQVIFDARGLKHQQFDHCGFQKFVGIDLELESPHGLNHPIIMDVSSDQIEGYRFFYLLPWSSHSILIEDTRYSSNPNLNLEDFKNEIRSYCKQSQWKIKNENRIESGSLPIPLTSASFTECANEKNVVPIGIRGGYFHWTTGYSFSYAVRVAESISNEIQKNSNARKPDFEKILKPIQTEIRKQSRYLSTLNRMLFLAAEPSKRWKIFKRFYHFNEDLIFRFYKGDLKLSDQVRILAGRPPVPIHSALRSIFSLKKGASQSWTKI